MRTEIPSSMWHVIVVCAIFTVCNCSKASANVQCNGNTATAARQSQKVSQHFEAADSFRESHSVSPLSFLQASISLQQKTGKRLHQAEGSRIADEARNEVEHVSSNNKLGATNLASSLQVIRDTRGSVSLTRRFNANANIPHPADEHPYIVVFVFAGRRDRMYLLMNYLDSMLSDGKVHEVHLWNLASDLEDASWVSTLKGNRTQELGVRGLVHEGARPEIKNDIWKSIYLYYAPDGDFVPMHRGVTLDSTVMVKSDDDIVYVDMPQFQVFAKYVFTHPSMFLVFPNIINNGVCAYYQSQHLPELAAELPLLTKYHAAHTVGGLVHDGDKAVKLHRLFLANRSSFSWHDSAQHNCIKHQTPGLDGTSQGLISINFFGARRDAFRHMPSLMKSHTNDEHALTELATQRGLQECIFTPFSVSHLSFRYQRGVDAVLPEYDSLWRSLPHRKE